MAFVDEITLEMAAGKGGDGVVRWRQEKGKDKAGAAGGNGGKGGDVYIVGVRDLAALAQYRYEKKFAAEAGEAGKNELKKGLAGKDLFLKVPVGTSVYVVETGEEYEVTKEGEQIQLFRGGRGGLGNARFKSATHQNPFEKTLGKPGKGSELILTRVS